MMPKHGGFCIFLVLSWGIRVNERKQICPSKSLFAQKMKCKYGCIDGQYCHFCRGIETAGIMPAFLDYWWGKELSSRKTAKPHAVPFFLVLIIYHMRNVLVNKERKFYLISYKFPGWYPGTNKHLKLRFYLLNVLENIYNAINLCEILVPEMFLA